MASPRSPREAYVKGHDTIKVTGVCSNESCSIILTSCGAIVLKIIMSAGQIKQLTRAPGERGKPGAWGPELTYSGVLGLGAGVSVDVELLLTSTKWELTINGQRRPEIDFVHVYQAYHVADMNVSVDNLKRFTPSTLTSGPAGEPIGEHLALQVVAALRQRPGLNNGFVPLQSERCEEENCEGEVIFLQTELSTELVVSDSTQGLDGVYVRDTGCQYKHETKPALLQFDRTNSSWVLLHEDWWDLPVPDPSALSMRWGTASCSALGGQMTFRSACGKHSCLVTAEDEEHFVMATVMSHTSQGGLHARTECGTRHHSFDSEGDFVAWLSKRSDADLLSYSKEGSSGIPLSKKRLLDYTEAVLRGRLG